MADVVRFVRSKGWAAGLGLQLLLTGCGAPIPEGSELHVIYGEDDRKDLYEVADSGMIAVARATALILDKSELSRPKSIDAQIKIRSEALKDTESYCAEERFLEQPTAGFCTGFLIAPDLLVSAAHCIESKEQCKSARFVFDYNLEDESQNPVHSTSENIYQCEEIVSRRFDPVRETDFVVVRLDRAVSNRQPLRVRQSGKIQAGVELMSAGYPLGLPAKIVDRGALLTNRHPAFFTAAIDTYEGGSGSPVLDARTKTVEGVLVRGEDDFRTHGSCVLSRACSDDRCSGEDVVRMTEVLAALDETQRSKVPEILD